MRVNDGYVREQGWAWAGKAKSNPKDVAMLCRFVVFVVVLARWLLLLFL